MSFLGNSRPDLLKNNAEPENTSRGADTRYMGDVPAAPEPVPSFGTDRYSSNSLSAQAGAHSADQPISPDQCTNVLASGARWKGSLKVEDSARIDGVFSGDIDAKGTVHVSQGAEVDAKIHAAFVVVSGSFRGEIRADRKVDLMPTSRVTGEVVTKALSIQEGAILDGTVQMTTDAARTTTQSRNNNRNGASADPEERRARAEAAASAASSGSNGGGA